MFEVDDVAILRRALFDDINEDWFAEHPYGPAFKSSFGACERHMPPRVYSRYRQEWQNWFPSLTEENWYRDRGLVPDIDTYLPLRRISVALLPSIVCLEYVLGLDLTDIVSADPTLEEARLVAVDHAMLVNDLCSFRGEYFRNDHFNTVSVLMHAHGCSLQEAINENCEMIRFANAKLVDLCGELRMRYALYADMLEYISALMRYCAGNLRWSLETPRYNGRGFGWNGLRSGIATLIPDATIIEEESVAQKPVSFSPPRGLSALG
ncbi:hypothetical protein GZH49_37560 [Nocardia terpenica]|uniref:terpene synthase family protein n=1 Tax=Nocardia terpenica TaxID=455432 RepID=UPI002FE07D12